MIMKTPNLVKLQPLAPLAAAMTRAREHLLAVQAAHDVARRDEGRNLLSCAWYQFVDAESDADSAESARSAEWLDANQAYERAEARLYGVAFARGVD